MGGLTVLRALGQRLPNETFVYLGDTARLPYGTKSAETVQAYALEADRSAIAVGQKVRLRFDARPDLKLEATIGAISGAPATKMELGAGRYFTVTIPLDGSADLGLLPSSSVRVEPVAATPAVAANGGQP